MQHVRCVGLETHSVGLIERYEIFEQISAPGADMVFVEEWRQQIQGFGEITRKVTSLQVRQSVSAADALRKIKGFRRQLLTD